MDAPVLLTTAELATLIGYSRRTCEGMRVRGDGPRYFKLRGRVRYDLADILAWLESQRRTSTTGPDDSVRQQSVESRAGRRR